MRNSKAIFLLALTLLLSLIMTVNINTAQANDIVRIGIMSFKNKANGLSDQQAEIITDIFTRMLAHSRSIAIIERERLDFIAREHRLNMSGLVDTNMAVQIGRLAGCQYMLQGSITQFEKNVTDQKFMFVNETQYDVAVTVDMSVVNVTTGEIVLSMAETGTATRKDSMVELGKDMKRRESSLAGLEGEAVDNAVSKLGQRIRELVAGEYSQVLSAGGSDITLNVGASSGARMGGLYKVYADGSEVFDMDGRVIGRKTINIAVVKIIEVQNEFSVANVVKNGGNPANIYRGDKITPISAGEAKELAKRKAFPAKRQRPSTNLDNLNEEDLSERLSDIAQEQGVETGTESKREAPEVSVASVPSVNRNSSPVKKSANSGRENKSTDPVKVIPSYGLPSGEANTRRIAHINARKLGSRRSAYNKYVELANSYDGDYLAAFRAGEIAQDLGMRDEAMTWFDKALAANPKYEPAQKARDKLDSSSSSSRKGRSKRRK